MTNVKVQIPNECQITKPKTNKHETTKFQTHENRINLIQQFLDDLCEGFRSHRLLHIAIRFRNAPLTPF